MGLWLTDRHNWRVYVSWPRVWFREKSILNESARGCGEQQRAWRYLYHASEGSNLCFVYIYIYTHTYNDSLLRKILLYSVWKIDISGSRKKQNHMSVSQNPHSSSLLSFGHSDHINLQIFLQPVFISFLWYMRCSGCYFTLWGNVTSWRKNWEEAVEILRR